MLNDNDARIFDNDVSLTEVSNSRHVNPIFPKSLRPPPLLTYVKKCKIRILRHSLGGLSRKREEGKKP